MTRQPAAIWSIILAAGEGSRLKSLTTCPGGETIPKQFCSLQGGPSLIQETIQRAFGISSWAHVCAVVAAQQQHWWQQELWPLSDTNIIVQPENKGTANGVLLPLLHVISHDPNAQVVLLPSDHYVADEAALRQSILHTLDASARFPEEVVLLGVEPGEADPELGYIVPAECTSPAPARVSHFVEKPSLLVAQELVRAGALWNTFIIVARASALLALMIEREREIVWEMQLVLDRQQRDSTALNELYKHLPSKDFSRHVLQGMEHRLRVAPARNCGWSDLGTPQRIERVLKVLSGKDQPQLELDHAYLNLASQYSQFIAGQERSLQSISQ